MDETTKRIITTIVIAAIVSFGVVLFLRPAFNQFGGYTEGYWDSAGGYKVDGSTVIDGSGNVDATITSDTGTFSSTLDVTGALSGLSTLTMTGESNIDTLVQGGDAIWVYASTTLTAAQVCNSSVINIGLATDAMMELTLPTTATLVADCLTTAGDHKVLLIRDAATSTLAATIIAGAKIDLEGDDTNADVLAAGASVELELYVATSTDMLIGVLRPFTDVD